MTVLHFGVIDVPYVANETLAMRKVRLKKAEPKPSGALTTGDVAEFLENKYHIMEIFFEIHKDEIVENLTESVKDTMEAILSGASINIDPFGEATSKIEENFKGFLSNREMENLGYPGVPTKAALMGVNHRLKRRHGPPRPSFIDTGLYQASFKSWIED